LSTEEEAALGVIGWNEPRLPDKPNWWAVQATLYPDTSKLARLVLGTLGGVYGLCGTDLVTGKLFDSPRRGDTPASSMSYPSANFVAPSEGREAVRQYGWSDAFHRSRLSPVVFVVAADFVEPVLEVLAANGVPLVSHSSKSDSAYSSAALLDGLVISVLTYGFPAGQLSTGWRVLGRVGQDAEIVVLLRGANPRTSTPRTCPVPARRSRRSLPLSYSRRNGRLVSVSVTDRRP